MPGEQIPSDFSAVRRKVRPIGVLAGALAGVHSPDDRSLGNKTVGLRTLGDVDLHAGTVDFHWQDLAAGGSDRGLHSFARVGLNQHHYAAAATCPADLSRESSLPARPCNDAVDRFGGDSREIALSEGPLFSHQPPGIAPVLSFQLALKFQRDLRDTRKVEVHLFVSIDMFLEDIPIVDGRLPRLSRVAEHD